MNRKYKFYLIIALVVCIATLAFAMGDSGNHFNDSFVQAKKWLEKDVYYDHQTTIYCQAQFNQDKRTLLPKGFTSSKYQSRSNRIEWEHIVPAENFGRTFSEWRSGDAKCVDKNGKPFKGRKCAELANQEYRYMQADMYNLYPAIGSVNALRQNYNFTQFESSVPNSFGSCAMKIQDNKVEPPPYTRGIIGRTYLYFEKSYPRYHMSDSQRQLMQAWDKQYPVDKWECERACRIQRIQKNKNPIVLKACSQKNMWSCPD